VREVRTVLEQKIRERQQTLEEFAEYVENFAREQNEPGTIGVRHLQRLVSGRGPKGRPLGPVRPATARLLEAIFHMGIDELLAAPSEPSAPAEDSGAELRQILRASSQINEDILTLLQEQMSAIRRLDRQLGAVVAQDEAREKANQIKRLLAYSISAKSRERLAAMLSELRCLVGWQALDRGNVNDSWQQYQYAKEAALESGVPSFDAHAAAGQAFVLIDIGETASAAELLMSTREAANRKCSRLMRAWIAAAHGEALAANSQRAESLRAFDAAAGLLPNETVNAEGPYVALDSVHLARWRGHALARVGDPEAVTVLTGAVDDLDSTFVRAEAGLRVDLATALAALGERDAVERQIEHAQHLATTIASARQQRRMRALSGT
jgi:hypothetical protein